MNRGIAAAFLAGAVFVAPVSARANEVSSHFRLGAETDDNANQGRDGTRRRYDTRTFIGGAVGAGAVVPGTGSFAARLDLIGELSRFRGMSRVSPGIGGYAHFYLATYQSVELDAHIAYETWSLHPARDGWTPEVALTYGLFIPTSVNERNILVDFELRALRHDSKSTDRAESRVFDTSAVRGSVKARVNLGTPAILLRYGYEIGDYISTSDADVTTAEAAEASVPDEAFSPSPSIGASQTYLVAYRLDARSHLLSAELEIELPAIDIDVRAEPEISVRVEHAITSAAGGFEATRTRGTARFTLRF